MPKKSAPVKKRVANRKVQKREKQSLSFTRLFGSMLALLVLGSVALFLHQSPHPLPLHMTPENVLPTTTPVPSPTLEPAVSHTQIFTPRTQFESTALSGMTRFLASYQFPKVRDSMSLDEFTIDSITNCSYITDSIQCNVIFSLKPHDAVSRNIGIDSGALSTDGWILGKHGVVLLRLSADNYYEVWSFAPGFLASATRHK